jgi:hypothetical protein
MTFSLGRTIDLCTRSAHCSPADVSGGFAMWSNPVIVVLLLSSIYAMPLGLFILVFRMVDD